jgi:hypothetical protein
LHIKVLIPLPLSKSANLQLEDMGKRSGRGYTILLGRAEIIALYELGRPRRHQPHPQLPAPCSLAAFTKNFYLTEQYSAKAEISS